MCSSSLSTQQKALIAVATVMLLLGSSAGLGYLGAADINSRRDGGEDVAMWNEHEFNEIWLGWSIAACMLLLAVGVCGVSVIYELTSWGSNDEQQTLLAQNRDVEAVSSSQTLSSAEAQYGQL